MRRIDQLASMRTFIAVVETGSFSAAARKLRVQQSTISRTVGALEEAYNAALLSRTTRKMKLTEAGHAFLADSRKILSEVDDLNARMKRIHEEPKGLLRIGLSTAFGKLIVAPTLPEFKQRFPGVTLEVHHDDRLVDIIAEGYDVVIRVGRSDDSLITSRKIAVVKRGLFGAKSLIRKLGPITTPQDLSRYPALLFGERVPVSPKWQLTKGRSRVSVPITSVTSVDQIDSLHALMSYGLGITYAPLFLTDTGMSGPPIERVLPDWDVIHRLEPTSGVYALFPGGAKVSAKVRVFVDFLVERMSAMRV
jgi:DNA-binding transcriptional LysR family regulator